MKMYLPSSLILGYVRAEMNVHAFMNELDQKDYWYPRKIHVVCLIKFNNKFMHNHLSLNIPKYKSRGKIYFHEKYNFWLLSSLQNYLKKRINKNEILKSQKGGSRENYTIHSEWQIK